MQVVRVLLPSDVAQDVAADLQAILGLVLGSRVYVHSSEVPNRNGGVSVMVGSVDLPIDVKRSFEILEGLCRVSLEAIGGALETKQFPSFFTPLLVCCLLDSDKTQGSVVIFNGLIIGFLLKLHLSKLLDDVCHFLVMILFNILIDVDALD